MMRYAAQEERNRAVLAFGVLGVHAALGWALLTGLTVPMPAAVRDSLVLVDLIAEPVPPKPPPAPKERVRRGGASEAPNLKARPSRIVAPPPKIAPVVPPPVVAAPVAGLGAAPSAGAAPVAGPGTGGGGRGDGFGDGEGDGEGTHSEWRSGRIKRSDYPRAAIEAGEQGKVAARVIVGPDGRVASCAVVESSGSRLLDDTTCRLIAKRFRYYPGRDAWGRAVSDEWIEEHEWVLHTREEWVEE